MRRLDVTDKPSIPWFSRLNTQDFEGNTMKNHFKKSHMLLVIGLSCLAPVFWGCSNENSKQESDKKSAESDSESIKETTKGEMSLSLPDLTKVEFGLPASVVVKSARIKLCSVADPSKCIEKSVPLIGGKIALNDLDPGKYLLELTISSSDGTVFGSKADVVIKAGETAVANLTLEKIQEATKGGLIIKINPMNPQPQPQPQPPTPTTDNPACVELKKLKSEGGSDCKEKKFIHCSAHVSKIPLHAPSGALTRGEPACSEKFARINLLEILCAFHKPSESEVKGIACYKLQE